MNWSTPRENALLDRAYSSLTELDTLKQKKDALLRGNGVLMPGDRAVFSVCDALRMALDLNFDGMNGLEAQVHRGLCRAHGEPPTSGCIRIPDEVLTRDLSMASGGAGGYLAHPNQIPTFVEALHARSAVYRLGARDLFDLRGGASIGRLTTGLNATWLSSEATQAPEQTPATGMISMTPHTVAAYFETSRNFLNQRSATADALLLRDAATALAVAIDAAAIAGSGSGGAPLGILNTPGIGSATGTSLGHAGLLDAQAAVSDADALIDSAAQGFCTTPTVARLLAGRQRFTGTDSPVWAGSVADGTAAGARALSSRSAPASTVIYGDWSQLLIAHWGTLMLEVNPFADFKAGIIGIRAMTTVDVVVRVPESFFAITAVT